jgi:glycosyltransferase involved in cell wall biosynthesis
MLGMLDGFMALETSWRIDVQSHAPAAAFHELPRRYPKFRHLHGALSQRYAAAVLPNQPWALTTVAELHNHAFVNVFNMLDTIAWDIIYPTDDHVEPAWRFIARHADGLAYISKYSMERFRRRFDVENAVRERVIHLSLTATEYVLTSCVSEPQGEHILLFGNAYDHKDLDATLELLMDAFPLQQILVIGGKLASGRRVKVIPTGHTSKEQIHQLIASARAVVYPSYYEGFGLPVVESLAYGRTVLVRASSLWREISEHAVLPGRLIEFDDPLSLIENLGRVLGNHPVRDSFCDSVPASTGPNWASCAGHMIAFVEECLSTPRLECWRARDQALKLASL